MNALRAAQNSAFKNHPTDIVCGENHLYRIVLVHIIHTTKHLQVARCNAIANLSTPNIVFFCSSCIQVVPVAVRHYDNQVLVESRITAVETSIQCSERKLHETVKSVESQIESFQKSIKSLLNEHTTQLSKVSTSVNAVPPNLQSKFQCLYFPSKKRKKSGS